MFHPFWHRLFLQHYTADRTLNDPTAHLHAKCIHLALFNGCSSPREIVRFCKMDIKAVRRKWHHRNADKIVISLYSWCLCEIVSLSCMCKYVSIILQNTSSIVTNQFYSSTFDLDDADEFILILKQ